MEGNIYYQKYRERMEINMIGEQKWSIILGMLWLACHNSKINWKIGEVKMMRYLEECRRQWRLKTKAGKTQIVEAEGRRKETGRRRENEGRKKKTKNKSKTIDVKKVEEE